MREGLCFDDVLLVPKHGVLKHRADADISGELFDGVKLRVPIISANMDTVTGPEMAYAMHRAGGIGALHREVTPYDSLPLNNIAIHSVRLKDGISRAITFVAQSGQANYFLLDCAHGDHEQVVEFVKEFRRTFFSDRVKLIVGNIATAQALVSLPMHLIDAVKVGIGPGAACRTREVTGFGVPQLTAIMDVRAGLNYIGSKATLIADGGIKNSGDIVKALAAGADTVMIGRLLAGCEEAPNGLAYRGNASRQLNGHRAPEGSHGVVESTGKVADVIKELAWGIRSGVSYAGATNLAELRKNVEFIKVSPLTHYESSVRITE